MRMSQLHQFAGDSARLATQRDRLSEQRRQWEASLPMAVHTLRNHALMCCDAEVQPSSSMSLRDARDDTTPRASHLSGNACLRS